MSSEFLVAGLILALDVVVTVLMLYLVTKLLDWSKDKPLPGVQSRIINIASVSLLGAVAMLLILDVELIAILPNIKGGLLALVEEIEMFATAVILLLIVFVFIMLRRIKKETGDWDVKI
jgi:hypothetical protein